MSSQILIRLLSSNLVKDPRFQEYQLERQTEEIDIMEEVMSKQETANHEQLSTRNENFNPKLSRSVTNWEKDPAIQSALQALQQEKK